MNKITLLALASILTILSCKKEEPTPTDQTVGGCTDFDSPLYQSNLDYDDGSCQYAYVLSYEITYHPEYDPNGSDWDFIVSTDADLIFRIKEEGASSWMFESSTLDNQPHNVAATWTAPTNIKLLNKNYYWELYDSDTDGDDFVADGTFNPIQLANNGTISTTGSNSSGNQTGLKLNYELRD